MREYTVAILGATGAVGSRLIEQLEQSTIPVKKVKLLASKRSAGKQLNFKGQAITIEEATPEVFEGGLFLRDYSLKQLSVERCVSIIRVLFGWNQKYH